jgi:hypothetical protein
LGAFAAGHPSPIPKKVVKQAIYEVLGHRRSFRKNLFFDWISARSASYTLALLVSVLAGWYALRTFSFPQPAEPPKEKVELIPDLAQAQGTPAFSQPNVAEASPFAGQPAGTSSEQAVPAKGDGEPVGLIAQTDQKLLDVLLSKDYENSRLSAAKNLLALWGKYPGLTEVKNFYSVAASQQMRCSEVSTNFEGLRSSNHPCILEMFLPQDVNPRYLVLAHLDGKRAEVFYADENPLDVPLDVLDEFWMRRAFIFWKDFEQLSDALKVGDAGEQVVWLQEVLQTLGIYQGQLTGHFDASTEEAVLEFQQRTSLLLDGIVGPKTKLALYGNLKQYSAPRLNEKI